MYTKNIPNNKYIHTYVSSPNSIYLYSKQWNFFYTFLNNTGWKLGNKNLLGFHVLINAICRSMIQEHQSIRSFHHFIGTIFQYTFRFRVKTLNILWNDEKYYIRYRLWYTMIFNLTRFRRRCIVFSICKKLIT